MEIKKQIESILLQFLSDEISKENLCKWAIDVLHKMLKGDIFYVKYLEMYGIITELAGIDDLGNDETKKSAQHLIRILLGDECASYCFAMQIPKEFVVNNLVEVHKILCKYNSGQHLSMEEIQKIISLTQKKFIRLTN